MLAALNLGALSAQQPRTWTDRQGRTLEATYLGQDGENVHVRRTTGGEVRIPKETLSEADLAWVGAVADLPAGTGGRFNDVTLPVDSWRPLPGGLKLGGLHYSETLETDHFIFAGEARLRSNILAAHADAAERLWHDMVADYPGLAAAFKERKMVILLLDGNEQADRLSAWLRSHTREHPDATYSAGLRTNYIPSITFGREFAAEHGFTAVSRMFRVDTTKTEHLRRTWGERIHFVSSDILRHWLGAPNRTDGSTFALVRFCMSYYREGSICGKIESIVVFGSSAPVEGFSNGKNWPGATKKLIKDGAAPDIVEFLKISPSEAQPRDLGFGYGLMRFIHDDPTRLAGFNKMLGTIAESGNSPTPQQFAEALGFASPDALNIEWLAYMNSDAF